MNSKEHLSPALKTIVWLLWAYFMGCLFVMGQSSHTISGTITDKSNGETLFGATVFLTGTTIGGVTNEYGFYSITAPEGEYVLNISYMGYTDMNIEVHLNQDLKHDVEISEFSTKLEEVVVTAEEPERAILRKPEMSVLKMNVATIKQTPVVLGEVDVLKSLQLLPGVTNNGEGTGGFHVRGGAQDQNLVLLDEAIIYNTSHMFGFFSVFNADAIKDVKLYKGGIPARFGGRVSSVLDIRQKDGNSKKFALTGGVGVISSRLTAEGPIFGDNGSFLIAGRRSYVDLILAAAGEDNRVSFYDLNLKTNYSINRNNKLFLSGYFGRDAFDFAGIFENSYGNGSGNLRWNHIFNDRLFSNLSAIVSRYDYDLNFDQDDFEWVSSITNYNLKYDLKYYLNDSFSLDFGANGIYYDFDPGQVQPTSPDSPVNPLTLDQKRALETGVYINAEHKLTDRFTAQYGLRYSSFSRLGGQPIMEYANGQPVIYNSELGIYERGEAIGETDFSRREAIETFGNLEPRVSLAYLLNENSSLKMGFSRAAQYIHLLSNTSSVTPLDVWTPSGPFIKPQLSNQYALGYFQNFLDKSYSLEVEAYYKTVNNRIDYIDGSELIGQNTIETEILNGEMRAYGLELLLRKNEGDLTGWIAYTLSKSEQRTPGGMAGGPGINGGNWYNTFFDRTHDISITGSYRWNDQWSFGANLIFQTGRPVTFPNGQYQYEDLSIASYAPRNSDRLPAYHRMDVSATFKPRKYQNKRFKGEWVLSIYNLYHRKNAASISFGQNLETGANEATRTAIFGIVPSLTYNFKF
ncbi:TonB-dependent receptor [Flagellimonas allohymeniacidonis]|uniref:TonB-dependent receptor n=1 Tax=Flagellimonas allohymeniacidonis TaxID=2517819 RepID=A0A4Q8QJ52_9FLAO|nr:TonB-dependent receptor [Allomuricauda hymeniacidonis]TAI48753.1 TonB-dependent receptor [Allomuricauda hymeniacidonis]